MKETAKKPGRGGVRPGSGRKSDDPRLRNLTIRIAQDVAEFLDRYPGRRSAIITEAVRRYRDELEQGQK